MQYCQALNSGHLLNSLSAQPQSPSPCKRVTTAERRSIRQVLTHDDVPKFDCDAKHDWQVMVVAVGTTPS
jgi:hypothetical protein